mmetsp:Transcript_63460/g.112838  ORF Transcript_63460/g.112838 Transcript_63460/m.112838 type:complete len:997 (+) Transcript_63460:62-3052(+)
MVDEENENIGTVEKAIHGYVRAHARRPFTICLSGLAMQLLLTAICFLSGTFTLDTDKPGNVWAVHDAYSTRMNRAVVSAQTNSDPIVGYQEVEAVESSGWSNSDEVKEFHTWMIFYKADDVFTPEALKKICEFELMLCKTGECIASESPEEGRLLVSSVRIFYSPMLQCANSSVRDPFDVEECNLLPQSHIDCYYDWIRTSVSENGVAFPYSGLMAGSLNVSGVNTATMTIMPAFANKSDVMMETLADDLALTSGFGKSMWEGDADDRHVQLGPLRVRFFVEIMADDFDNNLNVDMAFSLVACLLVYLVMWGHTQSYFLASLGMIQIFLSLPISVLVYKNLFMVDHFEFLHILILYVVLGIGADDVFVIVDSWRHVSGEVKVISPGRLPQAEMEKALIPVFKRSATAVFNTSLTTTVAFLSTGISKIMPMRTMGWFAACCIVENFLLMCLFLPSVVIIWHMRLQGKRCCCPAWTLREEATLVHSSEQADGDESNDAKEPAQTRTTLAEKVIHKVYLPFLKSQVGGIRVGASILVVISIATAVHGSIFAMQLTPPSKPEEWMPYRHMMNGFSEFRAETYYSAPYADFASATYTWGVKDLDMSEFNSYHPGDYEEVVEYSQVDLTSAEAQDAVLSFCQAMIEQECTLEACNNAGTGKLLYPSGEKAYTCFLEDFQDWLNTTHGITSKVTGSEFLVKLKEFRNDVTDDLTYGSEVKRANYKKHIGFHSGDLKYFSVEMRTSVNGRSPFILGTPVRDQMYDWLEGKKKSMPSSLNELAVASSLFPRYDMGAELMGGFFTGCLIAMPVAFVVLLVATKNIVISLYSVVAVASIVVSVLGFCKSVMDWDLGTGEAVAGVIVIGYSVDYTLHLSHMYCEASQHGHVTRAARTEFAVRNMGSTVFAGAATTFAAGGIMFVCYIRFFYKMAVLISITIFYSLLFSMGMVNGLLMIAGPQGNFGNLPGLSRKADTSEKLAGEFPGDGQPTKNAGKDDTNLVEEVNV